jgi:hypothetical protein
VCDNALNNASMMNELETYDLKQLKGVASRVHCVLHVVNLVAKVSSKIYLIHCLKPLFYSL